MADTLTATAEAHEPMSPDDLMETLYQGLRGESDIAVMDVVLDIIDDVLGSVRLAAAAATDDATAEQIVAAVSDYVANHYGR